MYEAKNYDRLLGLAGFSDTALKNHFTLYSGYVNNVNKLLGLYAEMEKADKMTMPEFAELKRRFGWEFNGMRLHELYFDALSKDSAALLGEAKLHKMIEKEYGNFASWEKQFKATGALRGMGWTILYYDKIADRLLTVWVNEHDVGHLAGLTPLLVLDVFEHAFLTDYGLKRADYIAAFWQAVDWGMVAKRIE